MTAELTAAERAILLAPCKCGHTINDHGGLAGCWDEDCECAVTFEALLCERVAVLVGGRDHTPRRGAGGNRFIAADSDHTMLAAAIRRGLDELHHWATDVGRGFDAGAITVTTKRIKDGRISVSVTGDLTSPPAGAGGVSDDEGGVA